MGAWLLPYRLPQKLFCYDGKHANVSDVSRWVEVKVDHDYTKNFQDGSLILALGNGPKQD